ncbi:hypothetical protein KVR01_003746 [Diaporthe batatas]|uniref:U2-type spliceosomal complex subunit CWC25 n=1 Tax=Diaporthe batatas TaxID=748121 RepID=UPI001D04346A|nr:U2-type spliceosomal complex subunit CWC25 [Diaporthe batatas]KAG8168057.1 hypothetical protein KVR01_003746 [Diaporthe batatas]
MGGNDLNLKKSWHPQLMSNQRRVYDAEQAALQERKLTEARLEEIRRERQIEETQKQLEAAGGQKKVDRVEWMYQGPNDGGRDEYSSEAFLLGKRRIDSVLRGDDMKKVEKAAGPTGETPGPLPVIASARDTAAKIREDPLVAIKRQEQGAYQAMMKDPSKRSIGSTGIAATDPTTDTATMTSANTVTDAGAETLENDHGARGDPKMNRTLKGGARGGVHFRGIDRHPLVARITTRAAGDATGAIAQTQEKGLGLVEITIPVTRTQRGRRGESTRIVGGTIPSIGAARRFDDRDEEEERARKLAAMQNDATDLDKAREARLAALAQKEEAEPPQEMGLWQTGSVVADKDSNGTTIESLSGNTGKATMFLHQCFLELRDLASVQCQSLNCPALKPFG